MASFPFALPSLKQKPERQAAEPNDRSTQDGAGGDEPRLVPRLRRDREDLSFFS
jgi:hypothetical protein